MEDNGYEIVGAIRESYIDGVWNKEDENLNSRKETKMLIRNEKPEDYRIVEEMIKKAIPIRRNCFISIPDPMYYDEGFSFYFP